MFEAEHIKLSNVMIRECCGGNFAVAGLGLDEFEGSDSHVKYHTSPLAPSRQEYHEHMVTHVPYRSWCPHCVRGLARADQHRKDAEAEGSVPSLAIDYAFMGKDHEREQRPPT